MRILRLWPWPPRRLAYAMCGCTQPWNVRKPPGDDVKTVASVGDKPLPIRSGTPEGSIRAEDTPTELPAPSPGTDLGASL